MHLRSACLALLVIAGSAPVAFAHGGAFRGPNAGGGQPSGGVPPGTADPPGPVTAWQAWWSANKEFHLRLHERMRDEPADITPSLRDDPAARLARRAREDTRVRARLVPIFLEALNDDSFEVRTAAAIALGKTKDERAAEPLRRALFKDTHKDVRDSALLALGMLGGDENLPFLVEFLNDKQQATRRRSFAAFGLGMVGGDDSTAMLLRFLGKTARSGAPSREQPPLVASCLVALGLADRPAAALPALNKVVVSKHHDDMVRSYAGLGIGRLEQRESLDLLVRLMKDSKAVVRRSAVIGVGKVATSDDDDAVKALFRAFDDADPNVRHFAAVALGRMGNDDILVKLEKKFAKGKSSDRPFLALALGLAGRDTAARTVRRALAEERNKHVRGAYCIALGLMGDRDAVPLLEAAAADKGHIWLSSYGALALAMLQSGSSAPLLREKLADSNDPRHRMNLAIALGLLHDPAARRYLKETLHGDGSIYERGSAAMAFGVLRRNESVTDLLGVYRNKKDQDLVRAFAVVSLGVLADPSPIPQLARFSIDNNYTIGMDPLNEVLSIM